MKCIRCGSDSPYDTVCPVCGVNREQAKEDAAYLAEVTAQSRPFRILYSSARFALIANLVAACFILFSGQLFLPLPLLMSSIGVLLLAKEQGVHTEIGENPSLPASPGILFTVSVALRAISCAAVEAVCISICLGGQTVLDRLMSMVNQYAGTDWMSAYNRQLAQLGVSITQQELYVVIYTVAIIFMFLAAAGLILNGIGVVFYRSLRLSAKSGKTSLVLVGTFSTVLLLDGLFNLFCLFASSDLLSLVLYSTTAYFNMSAFQCLRQLKKFLQ